MQEDQLVYLKEVYKEKNDKHHQIIKNTQWMFTVTLFFVVVAFIGIWLMYAGVIITDGHRSWVEALIFFFGVSFLISSVLMINIHKEPKVSLPIEQGLDVKETYHETIQKLNDQTEKLHRLTIGLEVTSAISIFCLILIIIFIL